MLILSSHLRHAFQMAPFAQVSPPKPYAHLCSIRSTRTAPSFFIDRPNNIWRGIQEHKLHQVATHKRKHVVKVMVMMAMINVQ
jgi:hypothetical protein